MRPRLAQMGASKCRVVRSARSFVSFCNQRPSVPFLYFLTVRRAQYGLTHIIYSMAIWAKAAFIRARSRQSEVRAIRNSNLSPPPQLESLLESYVNIAADDVSARPRAFIISHQRPFWSRALTVVSLLEVHAKTFPLETSTSRHALADARVVRIV